jgi:hypothetical protein
MRGVARYEQERSARTTFSRPAARAGQ